VANAERRYAEVDYVKALGIVLVPLIHTLRPSWDPGISELELLLGHVLKFAVPGFLATSGFLYATRDPVPGAVTRRRLGRVLLPYAIASVAAQIYHAAVGSPHSLDKIAAELFFGASFGPYYFVFLISVLILLTPLFARLSTAAIAALAVGMFLLQAGQTVQMALAEEPEWKIFTSYWLLRSPVLWWNYFLFGWLARLQYEALAPWVEARRRGLVTSLIGFSLGLAALHAMGLGLVADRLSAWLFIYFFVLMICTLSCGRERVPAPIRFLSDVSYSIYLFHLFFMYEAQKLFPHAEGSLDPLAVLLPWASGLLGPLLLIWIAKRTLGARARTLFGA
jgi:fucose 4-O-acetylase-like acetyltransferase